MNPIAASIADLVKLEMNVPQSVSHCSMSRPFTMPANCLPRSSHFTEARRVFARVKALDTNVFRAVVMLAIIPATSRPLTISPIFLPTSAH